MAEVFLRRPMQVEIINDAIVYNSGCPIGPMVSAGIHEGPISGLHSRGDSIIDISSVDITYPDLASRPIETIVFVQDQPFAKWQIELLEVLRIDFSSVVVVQQGEAVRIQRHIVPSIDTDVSELSITRLFLSSRIRHLLKKTTANAKVFFSRQLFIQRGAILGERAMHSELGRLGFTIVYPEEHTIVDQLKMILDSKTCLYVEGSACYLWYFIAGHDGETRILSRGSPVSADSMPANRIKRIIDGAMEERNRVIGLACGLSLMYNAPADKLYRLNLTPRKCPATLLCKSFDSNNFSLGFTSECRLKISREDLAQLELEDVNLIAERLSYDRNQLNDLLALLEDSRALRATFLRPLKSLIQRAPRH